MALREMLLELGIEVDQKDVEKAVGGLESVKKAAISVGALFTSGLLAAGYNKLVQLGSEAAESQNKFAAIFTESSEQVQKQLDVTSKKTGIASNELRDFASSIGALVKPALGSSEAAGQVGATMAELALDIASFNDVRPDEALVALRSGLIGSAEPLQRFGVDVRVAALEQEKFRLGIKGSIKSLTEAQRIQIRQSAILRQLGAQGALGDATKTADGFANATRGLSSNLKQLGQIIGGFLVKDAGETAVRFRDIVKTINLWFKANQAIIQQRVDKFFQVVNGVIDGLVMSVGAVIDGFRFLSEVLGPVTSNLLAILGVIAALVLILGAPVVLLLAIGAAAALVVEDLVVFAKGGESAFGKLIESAKEFLDQFVDMETISGFADAFVKLIGGLWDDVVLLWEDTLQPFFSKMLDEATVFINKAIVKSAELLTGLGDKIGEAIKTIFNSTIGRVILDFLGAKAGAVVGEFLGQLIGKMLAKVTEGEGGAVQRAVQLGAEALGLGDLREDLFVGIGGLIGKVGGAVGGGVAADELFLGVRESLSGGAATIGSAAPQASGGFSNQSSTTFNMEIDASGQNNPEEIGASVGNAVQAVNDLQLRQVKDAFSAVAP